MPYSVTTFSFEVGTLPKALEKVQASLAGSGWNGRLLACWNAEIGALSQIMIIQDYDSTGAIIEDRARMVMDGDPFGAGEFFNELISTTYLPFDFLPPIAPGKHGPVYEVRIYGIKSSGLKPTIELWREAIPERVKLSKLLGAMYAVDGNLPRFLHIWPFASLDERGAMRAKSVEMGIWPPKGGPAHLLSLSSAIYVPTAFSPLS